MFIVFFVLGMSLVYLSFPQKKLISKSAPYSIGCINNQNTIIEFFGKNIVTRIQKDQLIISFDRKGPVYLKEEDIIACTALWISAHQRKKKLSHCLHITYSDKACDIQMTPDMIRLTENTVRGIIAARGEMPYSRNHEETVKCTTCFFSTLCTDIVPISTEE